MLTSMPESVYIQFLNGPRIGERMQLEQFPVLFGRTGDSAIVLHWDGLVSSRHFEIFQDEGAYFLRDAGSRNGTKINGTTAVRQRLYHDDLIEVGNSKLQVALVAEIAIPPEAQKVIPEPHSPSDATAHPSPATNNKRINPFDSLRVDEPERNELQEAVPESMVVEQMRVRLVDISPSGAAEAGSGRIFWLSPGQTMTFGRSPRCDSAIESDAFLSSTHFRLICDSDQCLVEDLGSTSGTVLNGVRVERAAVFHGDRLIAGKTEFQIEIDGIQGAFVRPKHDGAAQVSLSPIRKVPTVTSPVALALTREKCPSGLNVLKGISQDSLPLPVIVDWLRAVEKIFLIVDAARGKLPLPQDYDPVTGQLFYWLPSELAGNSPQLISLDELPEWPNHLSDLQGNDGLVVLQSSMEKSELLAVMKRCLTGNSDIKKPFTGILGICWPSVMAAALQGQADDLANRLMNSVRLVITEANDGMSYQVFVGHPKTIDLILAILDQHQIEYTVNRVADPELSTDK